MRLFHELRRRQMFRLTGLYVVGAWLVIQVADIVFPTWGIPDSAMRFLFYAAFLGYPIVFVFGWIFDVRSDGIYRTRKIGPDEVVDTKMRWQDHAILAGLAVVGISIVVGSAERILGETELAPTEKPPASVERRENSVAVLPFENLDPNPETGYFSDGVADEILSKLANIRSLFVVGRASSFAFRDSDESPASVAAKLGVRYLLSGSVRRDGDLVRVTARLIDDNGSHIWSQSFDRKLESTLVIQSEIADEVANRILEEVSTPSGRGKRNGDVVPEAYNDYLLGKQFFIDRPAGWRTQALPLFRKAIQLDPDFAPAHAYYAIALTFSRDREAWDEAQVAAETALALDPELAETYVAMSFLAKFTDQDAAASIELLRKAIALDPTLSVAYNLLGIALMNAGRYSEARQVHRDALERDPLNPVLTASVAWQYIRQGETERGEKLMLRLKLLPQTPRFMYRHLMLMYWSLQRYDQILQTAKEQFRTDALTRRLDSREYWIDLLGNIGENYLRLGLEDQGYRLLELAAREHPTEDDRHYFQFRLCGWQRDIRCQRRLLEERSNAIPASEEPADPLKVFFLGLDYAATRDYEEAIEYMTPMFEDWHGELDERIHDPDHVEFFQYYIFALQKTDRDKLARAFADEAAAFIDSRIEGMGPGLPLTLEIVALNRWLQGQPEEAAAAFRSAVDAGWLDLEQSRRDPMWQEFLKIADFREELRRIETEIARQRAVVEAADAGDDFDSLVQKFIEAAREEQEEAQ